MGVLGLLLVGVVASLSRVTVSGDDTCPAPADVARQLDLLLAQGSQLRTGYDAYVLAVPERVHIDLVSAGGVRLAERDLPRRGSCDDLAKASAAVIATWLGVFEAEAPFEHGDRSPAVVEAPPPRPPGASVAAAGSRALPAPPATTPRNSIGYWVTVGLVASRAGNDTVAGAEVAAVVSRSRSGLGARASLFATTEHTLLVAAEPGLARWRRVGVAVGPSLLARARGWRIELHGAAIAALLDVQGSGFTSNNSSRAFDLGGQTGVRVARLWGNAAPWVGVDGLYWPGHQDIIVNGATRVGEVPRVELQLSAGLTLGSLP